MSPPAIRVKIVGTGVGLGVGGPDMICIWVLETERNLSIPPSILRRYFDNLPSDFLYLIFPSIFYVFLSECVHENSSERKCSDSENGHGHEITVFYK